MKKLLTMAAILAINYGASAQANYWKFGSTYFNCNTGAVASAPTSTVDLDATTFAVPGLCNAYYRASWDLVLSGPHYTALRIYDVSANPYGHPFNGTGDVFSLINDGSYYSGTSVAVAPIKNGTRKIYATYSNLIKVWTVNGDGTISGPTTLYTHAGSDFTDSRTETEVSSDGKYLLINSLGSPNSFLRLFDLTTNTLTNYAVPGTSSIAGFEYVASWSATPRLYVSYNDCTPGFGSASGDIGFGYFNVGTPGTLNSLSAPSGTNIKGFGFSEIELAKNGNLYLAYNSSLLTPLTTSAPLYSLTSAGVWGTVSSLSIPFGSTGNWGYALQKQIDGENYDAAAYTTPTVVAASVKVNGTTAMTSPSPLVPTVYTCIPDYLTLEADISGLMSEYELTFTKGTISGFSFIATSGVPTYTYVKTGHSGSLSGYIVSGSTPLASWGECDWKIDIKPKSACGSSSVQPVYIKFRYPTTVASTTNIKGVAGSTTPLYSASPVYRCGTEPWLMDYTIAGLGTNGYDVRVTKGDITPSNAFVADGAAIPVTKGAFSYGGSGVFTISLFSSFVDPAWVGSDWKVEVTPRSICGTPTATLVSYFKTRNASATIDYLIRSQYCTSGTQPRTTTVGGIATLGAVSTPVCSQGNLGAISAGFYPPTVTTTPSVPTNFNVKVEEVDATGAPLTVPNVIVDYTNSTLPVQPYYDMAPYIFTPTNASYFLKNYPTVAGSKIFKLTVGITTTECGLTAAHSYFKILDDGVRAPYAGGAFWRTTEEGTIVSTAFTEVNIMPNPAKNNVKVSWNVEENSAKNAVFVLLDVLGKEVLHQQWSEQKGSNEQNINIELLPSGVYLYKLQTGETIKSGRLIKQ